MHKNALFKGVFIQNLGYHGNGTSEKKIEGQFALRTSYLPYTQKITKIWDMSWPNMSDFLGFYIESILNTNTPTNGKVNNGVTQDLWILGHRNYNTVQQADPY